jgi:hypothetical protein
MLAIGKEFASEMVASDLMKSLRFIASSAFAHRPQLSCLRTVVNPLARLCAYADVIPLSATILAGISVLSADPEEYLALQVHHTTNSASALDTRAAAAIECVTALSEMNSLALISGQGSAIVMSASTGEVMT